MAFARLTRNFTIAALSLAIFFTFNEPSLPAAAALAADAVIAGVVQTSGGAAVPGALVTVSGATTITVDTDASGSFTATVAAGIYRVTVTKPGFETASAVDVTLAPGQNQPLTVTISEATLSTLRTIGSVTSSGSGTNINVGAATQSSIGGAQFAQLSNPQINDVLQRLPDIVVQKLGNTPDQSIVVGGLQPYETQVLIDGHPLALGQYGVWLSQYFPSYVLGGAETQSGPGNTTPFANIAVGGTVNLQTIGFTKKTDAEFTVGDDNWGAQFSNFTATGSLGKLDYVLALGTQGSNGYDFNKSGCNIYESDPATSPNTPGNAGIAAFCANLGGALWTRGQLYKLRYDFSPSTSLDVAFLGAYGGYYEENTSYGSTFGPTTIEQCIPGTYECTNPADANLIGTTVNGYYWYPGEATWSTQQIWTAQFRTAVGSATLLVRPYLGALQPETVECNCEGDYPAFFGPPPGYTGPGLPYPGPPSLAPGVQIPATGLPNPNAFESTACPPGNIYSYNQINSPSNTIVSTDGQEECFQYPYSSYEQDKLYGSTFSLIQPIQGGTGFLDLTYDFHGQSTFAYINSPLNVTVPFSATRYSTFSLTGSVLPSKQLAVNFGVYSTLWTLSGAQPTFDSSGNPTGGTGPLSRSVSRTDPHLALVYRPTADNAIRLSGGSSETFPFIGDVSGTPSIQPPGYPYLAGTITEKNPNLQPEYSLAFDLGADHRFHNGAVLSADLQETAVHNVFQQLTSQQTVIYNGQPALLGIFAPINVARLQAKLATVKYVHAPEAGFGYNIAATADSSILSGIPVSAYNASPGLPANNVQVCGTGSLTVGIATCIPYLKGYAQFSYTWANSGFVGLGIDYEGANNAYYQPPFAVLDLSARRSVTKNIDLNFSVQNLLNTNSYSYLPAPNLGVPIVADYTPDGATIQQGSYSSYLIPAATRTLRFWLRFKLSH